MTDRPNVQIFCNYQQDNWYTLLPLAEFAFNNTPSSTTGISLFFANKGYHPNLTIHPERDLASSRAKDLIVNLDELHQELKATIAEAQPRYQGPADTHHAPPLEFSVGKQAFVKAKFFCTNWPLHKLSDKYLGPFEILAKVRYHSYTLRLPDTFVVFIQFFMSPCSNLLLWTKSLTVYNLHHPPLMLKAT